MTSLIECRQLAKRFAVAGDEIEALSAIDLDIARGEYVAILGASGSGKSTLMTLLGCLDVATSGTYLLNGRNVEAMSDRELATVRNREIGFVFQSFNLLERSTALENVAQPLVYRNVPRRERLERAEAALHQVGLADRMLHLPNQLSGGQRQRVAVARALCGAPSLLIADEPTGNLDSRTASDVMMLFDDVHARGQTLIIVTHEPKIAARCRRNVTLEDGRIVSDTRLDQQVAPTRQRPAA